MPVQTPPQELHVKIIVIGNSSVGKSSLLMRWSENQWLPEGEPGATIGVEVLRQKLDVKGENVNLAIWDTAGEENFRTMQSAHYRGAQGIVLVYDSTNRHSFEELTRWFNEIRTYVSGPVDKVIVGNKVDKVQFCSCSNSVMRLMLTSFLLTQDHQRQVPTAEAAAFAKKMGCRSAETSAKTAVGVRNAFREMVERIVDNPELHVFSKPSTPRASFTRPSFLGYRSASSTR
ncbi:ras-domain-containing protein [Lactarius hatsudake]|nr:ras-domain-containing protein [Lactarius hatsudake]